MAEKLFALLSVDVEEEGLFSGLYDQAMPSIRNTRYLERLRPFIERGMRPTLFCAYSAFADAPTLKILEMLRDRHGVEIGAHLHHWNTPPWPGKNENGFSSVLKSVPACRISNDLLDAKLHNLFQAANTFQGAPVTTFRMGRWDLHANHWPLLRRNGVETDASVRPLHCGRVSESGPDHFAAPANPYMVPCDGGSILEVPLTATPLFPLLGRVLAPPQMPFRSTLRHWGALAIWPIQQPLWLMKLATKLYVERGGRTVQLTWHSSEMMPGGAPHMPDEHAVNNFMRKTLAYMDWLQTKFSPSFAAIGDLKEELGARAPVIYGPGDWSALDNAAQAEAMHVH